MLCSSSSMALGLVLRSTAPASPPKAKVDEWYRKQPYKSSLDEQMRASYILDSGQWKCTKDPY